MIGAMADAWVIKMDVAEFRRCCPYLVHYAPQIDLGLGLLTAAQVLDGNADDDGNVWARFRNENAFRSYPVDYAFPFREASR
jgi:hypothetical protein